MKIYFIASTLPFYYLKNITLGIDDLIVVSRNNLKDSLKKAFPKIKLETIKTLVETEKNVLLKSKEFFIFHECCWDDVDNLIKVQKKKTTYMPVAHVNYFDNVNVFVLIKILFQFGISKINIKSLIKYLYLSIIFPSKFSYKLQTNLKDKISFNLVKNLNYKKYDFVRYSDMAHGFKGSEKNISKTRNTIIFLLGNDVLHINDQMICYNRLIEISKSLGYRLVCKAHPRCDVKYNPSLFDEELDPQIPFEVMDIQYKYKVALFTTSLIFEPSKSISIESIIRNNFEVNKRFNLRSRYLRGFNNFDKIKIPEDYFSFLKLLK